jgi:hypothetical protein
MAKVWSDQGDGVFESTDTVVLQRTTREELVERKAHLEATIVSLQSEIDTIDADIAAIDAL